MGVNFDLLQPLPSRVADRPVMARPGSHQRLPDIAPGTDVHAQPIARVLANNAPFRPS